MKLNVKISIIGLVMLLSFSNISCKSKDKESSEQSEKSSQSDIASIIEEKTSEQLAWEEKVAPNLKYHPAMAYVADDPNLPRVLLIGDSISIGYTVDVRRLLKGKVNLHRAPVNCGPTTSGLASVDIWLGDEKWDVIHFNFGLHDMRHQLNVQTDSNGPPVHSIAEYSSNIEKIVEILKSAGDKIIFATTTPVAENTVGFLPSDPPAYNEAVVQALKAKGVEINDLYRAVLPKLSQLQNPNDVHFNNAGNIFLAERVAESIISQLP